MNLWKIEYWNNSETGTSPIEKWIIKLDAQQREIIYKQISMLKEFGNELQLPHSKALGKGLFELREKHFGYRIYYGFVGKLAVLLLAAGDKTSQDKDIKVARQRLSQIKNM